jgi:hypothetical protein
MMNKVLAFQHALSTPAGDAIHAEPAGPLLELN